MVTGLSAFHDDVFAWLENDPGTSNQIFHRLTD